LPGPAEFSELAPPLRVCLSVSACPRCIRKTAQVVNSKLATHVLYGGRSACIDPEVKGQGYTVTTTVTVAWLLTAAVDVVLLQPAWDCTS